MHAPDFEGRLTSLRRNFGVESASAFFVSSLENIQYLTGFTGSAGLLIVKAGSLGLIIDGRYEKLATEQVAVPGVEFLPVTSGRQFEAVKEFSPGVDFLYFDPQQVTIDVYDELRSAFPGVTFRKARSIIERLRLRKDSSEISKIRQAAQYALSAFYQTASELAPGVSEKDFASRLEANIRMSGADSVAFSSIVASGENSAKPHAQPTGRIIREGEPVVIDFGAMVEGYHSDITRTIWAGELDAQYERLRSIAISAYRSGVESLLPGVSHSAVDDACRKVVTSGQLMPKPLHPSGHSVGLSIHERPFLTPYASDEVEEGFVLTVEPGIYVEGLGGWRVENTIAVTQSGAEVLSERSVAGDQLNFSGVDNY